MQMIWHYYSRNNGYPFSVEIAQCLSDDLCTIMTPQNTQAVSGIEPALNRSREPLMIFALNINTPRLWINTQPCFTFRLPLSAQAMRHSVGESECNEVNCAFLLPMRQAIRCQTNICIRIEEAQFAHWSLSV